MTWESLTALPATRDEIDRMFPDLNLETASSTRIDFAGTYEDLIHSLQSEEESAGGMATLGVSAFLESTVVGSGVFAKCQPCGHIVVYKPHRE
jgi:hypothetical protein